MDFLCEGLARKIYSRTDPNKNEDGVALIPSYYRASAIKEQKALFGIGGALAMERVIYSFPSWITYGKIGRNLLC